MSVRGVVSLALALACGAAAAEPETTDVAVFMLSTIPVRADGPAVYELDRRDRLAAELGEGLPADPERARAEMRRRIESSEGRQLLFALAEAADGNALAARLGIEKLPAVVVDGRYAVYGVRDVRRALEIVAAWRREYEPSAKSGPGNARSSPLPNRDRPRPAPFFDGGPR